MTAVFLWVQLAATAGVILVASRFLTRSADVIAIKTGLGRSFVGVVLLATATSMPEMSTGVSSILVVGQPDLAAGDALGSNLVNLCIIGLLDLFWRDGPLLNAVSTTSILVGSLGIGITSLAVIAIYVHGATPAFSGWYLSPFSVVIIAVFLFAIYLIYRHDDTRAKGLRPEPGSQQYAERRLSKAVLVYAVSTATVIAAAVWLSKTGAGLAEAMGWEASFVGTQFLAISTSLPELATSFAAIRINAPDLALTNLLGSNLFNHGFVLFLDDAVYTDGVLWEGISRVHLLTGMIAIFMTCVVMIGLLTRPRKRPGRWWTPESAALISLYIGAGILVFFLA